MIGVSGSASRIAPTRPSIMSLGATTSAPASTWLTAVRTSSSSDSSLSTSPSRTTPQWPCDVYSHRQTSVRSTSSGKRGRRSRSARWTMPSSSQAPEASSSFDSGMPKRMTARTPASAISSTSRRRVSSEWRPRAGSSSFASGSGATKSGMTKSSRCRRVSRTRPRRAGVRRSRRRRVVGKALTPTKVSSGAELAVRRGAVDAGCGRVALVLQDRRGDHAQRRADPDHEVAADDGVRGVPDRVHVDPYRLVRKAAERGPSSNGAAEAAVDVALRLCDTPAPGADGTGGERDGREHPLAVGDDGLPLRIEGHREGVRRADGGRGSDLPRGRARRQRGDPRGGAEREAEAGQPGGFAADGAPRARVVERRGEKANRVCERQRVADDAGGGDDLPRDESEEDDREHDQERHERRRPRLARQRAEERAEPTEARPGEHEPETEERQPDPRLAARHAAHLDDHAEGERDCEPD